MKNQRATEVKVGITVLLGLVVFIWILSWTKNFTFSSSDHQVLVKFNNVSGLEIGNNVTVNGVKKGHVSDYYIQEASVIVILSVDSEIELKKDATFFLESTDLMGGRKIEIFPGSLDEALDYKGVHQGTYVTDIAGVIALFGDLQDKISIIANETATTLQTVNSFLKDKSFVQELRNSLTNLNRVTVKLDQVLTENQQNLKEISENTKDITAETRMFLRANGNNIENTLKNLNSTVIKSDSLIAAINYLTKETMSGGNNLGKILYNDSLYISIVESIQSLKQLTKLLNYQLQSEGIKVDASIF